MKKIFFSFFLLICYLILTSSGGSPPPPVWEQENVSFPMMNQEIRHAMNEHERQKEMKNKQVGNTASETINKGQWTKWKKTATTIQDRLRHIDFVLQAIPAGIVISREAKEIKENQIKIINEIRTAPYALIEVFPKQVQFIDDLQMVIRFLTGIVVSYGAINQMERAERKILLDYGLSEVERLNTQSYYILTIIRETKQKFERNKALLNYYINADKEIVDEIINNIKTF